MPQFRRWWVTLLLLGAVLAFAGRSPGSRPVHADSDPEWIKNAVARADLDDADAVKLRACLQGKLAAGTDRLNALGPCFVDATVPTSADEVLAGLADPEAQATLNARSQAARTAADQILKDLKERGASQGELDNLKPQLIACMLGWAPLTDNTNDVATWCRQDVEDFDRTVRGHPEVADPLAPVIGDFGCPADLTVGKQFDCLPSIAGTVTEIGYGIDAGAAINTTEFKMTVTLADSEQHVLDLAACNMGHCSASDLKIQASLPAPTGGSAGCPATANPGETFSCNVAGWSPTDSYTSYTWTASAGGAGTNIADSYDITFPTDDTRSVSVTLLACNGNSVLGSHPSHCTTVTATVSRKGATGAPDGSISCTPSSGPASADSVLSVTCTANLTNADSSTTKMWSSPGAVGEAGSGDIWVALLDKPGKSYVITLTACNGSACFSPSFTVTTDAGAPSGSVSCTPADGNAPLTVNCTSNLTGTIPFTTVYGWSSTGSPGGATDDPFLFPVTFDKTGNQTVTLHACNGSACTTVSTTVTVNPPLTPPGGTIGCGPLTANTGDRISCSAQLTGTVTSTTWSALGGSPSSGAGTSFSTSYTTTGTQTITLQACNGPACANYTASVNILRKAADATPAPTPVQQRQPITLTGTIQVTEGDVDCGFSAMPSSTGTISITLTFGSSPGDPIVASGNFSGGTSGSRSVRCQGGTATEKFQASYSANFNGVVASGGSINLTGRMSVTQSSTLSDCKDNDGKTISCPAGAKSTSYAATVLGTITVPTNGQSASGSGSLDLSKSGCSTAGQWNAH